MGRKPKRITTAELKRLQLKWYRKAQKLDPSIILDDSRYLESGGRDPEPGERNRHSPHRSLDAVDYMLCNDSVLATDPKAEFWQIVVQHANALPKTYPCRAFLLRLADTGNLEGSARAHKLTVEKARWAWRKFLLMSSLPDPDPQVPSGAPRPSANVDPFKQPSASRYLSPAEISQLTYLPPPPKESLKDACNCPDTGSYSRRCPLHRYNLC